MRKPRKAACNSTYNKLAVQWLNEALCFVSTFVVADITSLALCSSICSNANRYNNWCSSDLLIL